MVEGVYCSYPSFSSLPNLSIPFLFIPPHLLLIRYFFHILLHNHSVISPPNHSLSSLRNPFTSSPSIISSISSLHAYPPCPFLPTSSPSTNSFHLLPARSHLLPCIRPLPRFPLSLRISHIHFPIPRFSQPGVTPPFLRVSLLRTPYTAAEICCPRGTIGGKI